MSTDESSIQQIINRIHAGEVTARNELIEYSHCRLRHLVHKMLVQTFPKLRRNHDTDSLLSQSWIQLRKALESVHLETSADFFRLAAHKIRQTMLTVLQNESRTLDPFPANDADETLNMPEVSESRFEPIRLMEWTAFHEKVGDLSENEQSVFEMCFYMGLKQTDVSKLLELHPRKVSRLWVGATEKLKPFVPEVKE